MLNNSVAFQFCHKSILLIIIFAMSRRTTILNIFDHSPIQLMQKQALVINEGIKLIVPFFTAVMDNDWELATDFQGEVMYYMKKAHELKYKIYRDFPRKFLLGLERNELINLINHQNDLTTIVSDIIALIMGAKIVLPKLIRSHFFDFLEVVLATAGYVQSAIELLESILNMGFNKQQVQNIQNTINQIYENKWRIRNKCSLLYQKIYDSENSLCAVANMLICNVVVQITGIVDKCEQIGAKLQLIIASAA